jgi:hypothetical protein
LVLRLGVVCGAKGLSKHKYDLLAIQEVRWDTGVTKLTGLYTVLCGKGKDSSYKKIEHVFNKFP